MKYKISQFLTSHKLVTFAFGIILASLVFVYYRVEPSPSDYMVAVAALLVGVAFLIQRDWKTFSIIDGILGAYLIFIIVQALLFWEELDIRFAVISVYLFATYFVVNYVVSHKVEERVRKIWLAYLVGATITAVAMMVQMVLAYSYNIGWNSLYFGRPNGWFQDANVAGPFLLPAIYYSYYWFLSRRRWLHLLLFLVFSAGLFLSFSRGAYLGYAVGLVLLTLIHIFIQLKERQSGLLSTHLLQIAISLLSVICLWLGLNAYQPFSDLAQDRFGVLIKEYDTQGRAVSWETGVKSLGNSPFGSGSGSYEKQSLEYQKSLSATPSASPSAQTTPSANQEKPQVGKVVRTIDGEEIIITPSAHNTYLRVLLENGVIGLALLVSFWAGLALLGINKLFNVESVPTWIRPYLIVTLVSFLAFLPMGLFIDTLHWRILWVMAGILSAIIFSAKLSIRKD